MRRILLSYFAQRIVFCALANVASIFFNSQFCLCTFFTTEAVRKVDTGPDRSRKVKHWSCQRPFYGVDNDV